MQHNEQLLEAWTTSLAVEEKQKSRLFIHDFTGAASSDNQPMWSLTTKRLTNVIQPHTDSELLKQQATETRSCGYSVKQY